MTRNSTDVVPFNVPYTTGRELEYLATVLKSGMWVGGGPFTQRCEHHLEQTLGLRRSLLTTSCSDALELAALLLDIRPGDEVIVPSFTFVSTANAFALRGATIRFADSYADNPNIDPESVRRLITPRTRCICVVHYAGVACDMDAIMELANAQDIAVVEDAAQAIDAQYRGVPLGTIGRFGAISFHGTKNIAAGEGGALLINRPEDVLRAEIMREKGTNRSAFVRGEVDKYGWVDLGSSFIPSELIAAVLLAQLEALNDIQALRLDIWQRYHAAFADLEQAARIRRPNIPDYATNNAHMYYLICASEDERNALMDHLKELNVKATFHYTPLHNSTYQLRFGVEPEMPNAERFHACLVRLPLFAAMTPEQVARVIDGVRSFFAAR